MLQFIFRRLFTSILTIALGALVVFYMSRGLEDPRYIMLPDVGYGGAQTQQEWNRLGKQLHLDSPVIVQFGYWVGGALRGHIGNDLTDRRPLAPKILHRLTATVELALVAWVAATLIGIPLGIVAAVKRGTAWDYAARSFALIGQAVPVFWFGLVLIIVFAVWLRWFPAGSHGYGIPYRNFVLPAISLAWLPAAGYLRFTRSAMLEVLDSEYVKLARIKGVGPWKVIWKHAFRNAALVPLTATGLVLAGFITGSVLVETVFAWPGIGQFTVQAVNGNDINALVAIIVLFTALFVAVNFIVDILYALIDPRIRYS